MLRLKRIQTPRYAGGDLPDTVYSRMETRPASPSESSTVIECWIRREPPAMLARVPSGECQLKDRRGFWLIFPERREALFMGGGLAAMADGFELALQFVVARYAMAHIRRFGELVPPEHRSQLFVCEAAAEAVEPPYHEFHWKSRSPASRVGGFLRYDPEDGWVRHLEMIERDLQSGEVLRHGFTTGFEYNRPLPDELLDPIAAGFRLLQPDEYDLRVTAAEQAERSSAGASPPQA